MEPGTVPSQACYCYDNPQDSLSYTKQVGFWLEEPTFTNGQLYIAASKVGDPQHLHFEVSMSVRRKTRNDVYKEVL